MPAKSGATSGAPAYCELARRHRRERQRRRGGIGGETANSSGYVELTYAVKNGLTYGTVRSQSGNFVQANLASVTAAAAQSASKIPDDFRVSITNAPGEKFYPIASFTWLLHFGHSGWREAGRHRGIYPGGDWRRGRIFLSPCLTHACRTR